MMGLMDRSALIKLLKELEFTEGEWAAFGGACLVVRGLRASNDLDIFASLKLFNKLSREGWEQRTTSTNDNKYLRKQFGVATVEIFLTCGGDDWRPEPEKYISNPEMIDGFPFMPLKDLYEWKAATRRPKDLRDIELINKHWRQAEG